MIEITNLSKDYKIKDNIVNALSNVNLTIESGQIYGIIGYSGAGKSTLVRCINLLELPDKGNVKIDGEDLTKEGKKQFYLKGKKLNKVRKNIGMIFQHFNLLDRSTVFENIAYTLKYSKKKKEEINNRVFELLDLVDLKDKADVYPSQLSGGQKQRVAIARALANNPKILLSDEATSALDPDATKSILDLLKKLNKTLGITIVVITHEMDVVKEICDNVAVMENGEIVESGSVYNIFAHPQKEITKKFVKSSINEDNLNKIIESNVISFGKAGKLVRLTFDNNVVGEALISKISSNNHVDVNIILANVEIISGLTLGTMICKINGDIDRVNEAIKSLEENLVNVEVLYE